MVTQKQISLKIDLQLLEDLDKESMLGWNKRNTLINKAVRLLLDYQDTVRKIRSYGELTDKKKEICDFEKRWFPMIV